MATSVRDLLGQVAELIPDVSAGQTDADCAVVALGHIGRALDRLAAQPSVGELVADRTRRLVTGELALACGAAARQWPSTPGRLVDVTAACADVIGQRAGRLDRGERWAHVAELGSVAHQCVAAAASREVYQLVPALQRVARLSAVLQAVVERDPPGIRARASLDAAISVGRPAAEMSNADQLTESTAGLVLALGRAVGERSLTMPAVLAACAASESSARYARAVASVVAGQPAASNAWTRAPEAWRVTAAALIRFDDGSRLGAPAASEVIARALTVHHAMSVLTGDGVDADAATAARYAANQLPQISWHLETVMRHSAQTGRLLARATSLPRVADRLQDVIRD